jgi:eukaryotic-like serine/threonine-protein kinase
LVGQTIGHYKILDKLGEGGMGLVYKAQDTQLQRTVALKFLSKHAVHSEETKKRLIREAQAAGALDHPHICTTYGIHEEEGHFFVAMAYIRGPTLADKIKERPLVLEGRRCRSSSREPVSTGFLLSISTRSNRS